MRRSVRRVGPLVVLLVFCVAASGAALGDREHEAADDDVKEFAGRLSVQGNEPHTFLALQTSDEVFRVVGPLEEELLRHQGQQVRLAGRIKAAGEMGRPATLHVTEILEAGRPAPPPPEGERRRAD